MDTEKRHSQGNFSGKAFEKGGLEQSTGCCNAEQVRCMKMMQVW